MQDKMQQYLDANKMHSFEGSTGVRRMEKIMQEVCGYHPMFGNVMSEFFADNPGAVEAVVEWIGKQSIRDGEWAENLAELLDGETVGED
jgi:prephenate dehydrogenase